MPRPAEIAPPPVASRVRMPAEMPPRVHLLTLLGSGSMGRVHLALDLSDRRIVAVKSVPAGIRNRTCAVESLRQEARILAGLRHPGIVREYGLIEDGGPVLLLEAVAGVRLDRLIRRHDTAPGHVCAIVRDVALALAYCHRCGIVHGDIKPENILVRPNGRAVLIDFGLARRFRDEPGDQGPGTLSGSPTYMAPELFTQGPAAVSPRADVYSLGAVFHELLTGQPPVVGELGRLLQHAWTGLRPKSRLATLPISSELRSLCEGMLAHRATERIPGMADVIGELSRRSTLPDVAARSGMIQNCV